MKMWKLFALLLFFSLWGGTLGYFVGKRAADIWYAKHRNSYGVPGTIVIGKGVCSDDGRVWWSARPDGICYLADKP